MHKAIVAVMALTALMLAGCGPDDYFADDEESGIDLALRDSTIATDLASDQDSGNVANELRLYKSGSRIKAKVLTTADGSQAFLGWYDNELEMDCYVFDLYRTDDGKLRYLPASKLQLPSTNNFFGDSNCKQKIHYTGVLKECGMIPEWIAITTSPEPCNSQYRMTFYRHSQQFPGSKIYKLGSDDECSDVTDLYSSYIFLASLGERVDPGIFAEATALVID